MRIFIADDRPRIRSAVRLLFEQEEGVSVVGEAAELEGLLAGVQALQPDIVLLDWELPGRQGALLSAAAGRAWYGNGRQHLLSLMRALCPRLFVVALSSRPGARQEALAAGADAFVSKGEPPEILLAAVSRCRAVGQA